MMWCPETWVEKKCFTVNLKTLSSIHFHSHFSSQEDCGGSSPVGRLDTPHGKESLTVLLVGPSKAEDVITPPGPWLISGSLSMGVASRTYLVDLSWDILVTWSNQCSWDLSIQRSGLTWHSGFTNFTVAHFVTKCCEFFAKILSLPLILQKEHFQSLHKIHDNGCGLERRSIRKPTSLQCLKDPVLWPSCDKA